METRITPSLPEGPDPEGKGKKDLDGSGKALPDASRLAPLPWKAEYSERASYAWGIRAADRGWVAFIPYGPEEGRKISSLIVQAVNAFGEAKPAGAIAKAEQSSRSVPGPSVLWTQTEPTQNGQYLFAIMERSEYVARPHVLTLEEIKTISPALPGHSKWYLGPICVPAVSSPREADQSPSSVGAMKKALEGVLAAMDVFGENVLSGKMSDEAIGGCAPIIVGAWADQIRAALADASREGV